MEHLTLLYDARCVLCTRTVETLRRLEVRADLCMIPLQEADAALLPPGITREELLAQLHVIDGGGMLYRGVDAVVRILRTVRGLAWLAALFRVPGMKPLADTVYRLIARHRYRLFGSREDCGDGACSLHDHRKGPKP
jgi:predicted DCC family thiol-disulfide oxidoreductase YuxK